MRLTIVSGSSRGLAAPRGPLSADTAAARVLAYLERPDFGTQPVADLREA